MRQRHPPETQYLAPFGFVFPQRKKRLDFIPKAGYGVNGERVIARLWQKWNMPSSSHPIPIQTILHEILPPQGRVALDVCDFMYEGLSYSSRDILVLSSTVQWLGTNIGGTLLEPTPLEKTGVAGSRQEFVLRLNNMGKEQHRDMPAFFCHICTSECTRSTSYAWWGDPCAYKSTDASSHDREVIDSLMYWLATSDGRMFIERYRKHMNRAHRFARMQWWKSHQPAG